MGARDVADNAADAADVADAEGDDDAANAAVADPAMLPRALVLVLVLVHARW